MPAHRERQRKMIRATVTGYLCNGRMPPGASYIGRIVNKFRRALDAEVLERKGKISLYDAALSHTASRHEKAAALLQRWLDRDFGSLSVEQRVAITREIGRSSDARDRCLRLLGLDRDERTLLIDSIYHRPPLDAASEPLDATDQADQADPTDQADQTQGD